MRNHVIEVLAAGSVAVALYLLMSALQAGVAASLLAALVASGLAGVAASRHLRGSRLTRELDNLRQTIAPTAAEVARARQDGAAAAMNEAQLKNAVSSLEARWQALFANTGSATAIVSDDGAIVQANHQFSRLSHIPPEEIVGVSLFALVSLDDREKVRAIYRDRRKSGGPRVPHFAFSLMNRDGDYRDVMATMDILPGSADLIVSLLDVTRRRQAEKELDKARKFESTAILAGGIAHDFNNLLAIVLGNTDLLRMKLADQPELVKRVDRVAQTARDAVALTAKFLTVAGGELTPHRPVRLPSLIRDELSAIFADSRIRISDEIVEPMPPVMGDAEQLQRVFHEILLNAREAMAKGGTLVVRSRPAETIALPDDAILPRAANGFAEIIVEDEGPGMTAAELTKVYDPYFSTKTRGAQKGMGLGLTIAYAIVRAHQGLLQVLSGEGMGTTVLIYLPLAPIDESSLG